MQGNAQQYPIEAQVQLMQPVSPQLSTLYTGTVPRMIITLLNKDLQEPSLTVKLRFTIKGTLATLRSKDYVFYRPIVLDAGVPTRLSLDDLAPYFNINNLEVSGIPLSQLAQTDRLPDGYYTFCVEVLEAKYGQVLSDPHRGCSPPAWITTSDPPLLNLPLKGESVAFRDPLNIIFNWTPRHMGSPNAAFNTEYEFTLVELWDNGIAPEAAFSSMPPLYQTTTYTSTLLYGPAAPPLIPGKKYGWRVQAKARMGADSYDVFNNHGYSEIFWFNFQDDCAPPMQTIATVESGNIAISWLPQPKMYEYTVDYREADKVGAAWFSVKSSDTRITIYNLVPGRKYEYRVGGYCSLGNKVLGDVHGFAMPDRDVSKDMTCGLLPDIKLTNKTPVKVLEAGEQVMVGDFPLKILQVSGSGSFTGYGYITVSFIGYNRVKVKFDNITVNTDRQLLTGVVETTFDKFASQIADVGDVINAIKDLGSVLTDLANLTIDADYIVIKDMAEQIKKMAEEELPDELKERMINAADNLEASKKAYDEAKKEYENATTEEEKAAAKEKVKAAKEAFETAKEEVAVVKKEKEKLVKAVANIIVKAIKELKSEVVDNVDKSKGEYHKKQQEIAASMEFDAGRKVDTSGIIFVSVDVQEIDIQGDESKMAFVKQVGSMLDYKATYIKGKLYREFFKYFASAEDVSQKFSDDPVVNGRVLIKEVANKQMKGETEANLIIYIKENLVKYLEETAKAVTNEE
jgi:hypothetical protein